MKIWTLLCWYDERADWLAELVESVSPLVDGIVAVDGAYALYPSAAARSSQEQHEAIRDTAWAQGLEPFVYAPAAPWKGNEVAKRAFLFELALSIATPYEDWFLIIDGDMLVNDVDPERLRRELAATEHHVAKVAWREQRRQPGPFWPSGRGTFRSLFRAIPGLTVEGSHSVYTVPDYEGRRLFLWNAAEGSTPEDSCDVTKSIELLHRAYIEKEPERRQGQQTYYINRSDAGAESLPVYTEE